MGRKSKCFRIGKDFAVRIPLKSAERIGLAPGCEISILFNAENELRLRRLGEPVILTNKRYGVKGNPDAKLIFD